MHHKRRRILLGAHLLIASGAAVATAQPLRFEQAAQLRRAHARELEAEALLAEAQTAAIGGGSFLLEAPTASLSTGPRHAEGETVRDLNLAVEVPLLAGRQVRLELAGALDDAAAAIRASARAIGLADLAAAFARAWLASTQVDLRQQDLTVASAWLAAIERRVDAGAEPAYESILVAGEHDRAVVDLLAARSDFELAWGELLRLASVTVQPQPLELASLPAAAAPPAAGDPGTVLAGIEAERELLALLARSRSGAASSRWSLAGDAAAEGDDRIAHVGFAYRFPLAGERAAITETQRAAEAAAAGDAEAEAAAMRGRIAVARTVLAAPPPSLDAARLDEARRALEARIDEGKARPSEVLPLRRQLLEAALALAEARALRAQAAAELFFLERGELP